MTLLAVAVVAFVIGLLLGRGLAPATLPPVLPKPEPIIPPQVTIQFRDEHDRKTLGTIEIEARARRSTLMHKGQRFVCIRGNDADGFVYRRTL